MNIKLNTLSKSQWWAKRRLYYNISLLCAGFLSFICYAAIILTNADVIQDADITIFTTLSQGIGYLVIMGIANICFYAGPILEGFIKPIKIERYRVRTYRIGYWFSVLLPFSIPASLLYLLSFHPDYWIK